MWHFLSPEIVFGEDALSRLAPPTTPRKAARVARSVRTKN